MILIDTYYLYRFLDGQFQLFKTFPSKEDLLLYIIHCHDYPIWWRDYENDVLRHKQHPRREHTPTSIISPGCRCSYLAPCPGLPSPTGLRPVYGTICFVPARYSGKHQTMLLCAQGMPTYGADAMNRIPTIKYSSVCV